MNNNKQFIKKPEVLWAFRFGYDDGNSYAFIRRIASAGVTF